MNMLAAIITDVKKREEKNIDEYADERRVALEWFKHSGKTQAQLSDFCKIGQSTISGIKDGTKGSSRTFKKIAVAFGKEYDDYFRDRHAHPRPSEFAQEAIYKELVKLRDVFNTLNERLSNLEKVAAGHEKIRHDDLEEKKDELLKIGAV